ncbi:MAG TPA: hypothetical protein VMM35_06975, partial [Longimicrobiales bacterium]|nr:hypothetical protein [Longimicrobiales bacterium]
ALDEYPAAEARRVREHLETCGECGKRLAAERRVREGAQDILALASPSVEIPSLEELRAYVKAQSPPRTKTRIRLYRLSWAASVVLALGTGWMLRGGVPVTTASGESGFAPGQGAASAPTERSAQPLSEEELELSGQAATGLARESADGAGPAAPDAGRALTANEPRRELAERPSPASPTGPGGVAPGAVLADATDGDAATSQAADDTAADIVAANTQATAPEPAGAPPAPPTAAPSAFADAASQDTALRDGVVAERAAEQRLQSAITQAPTATGLGVGAATPVIGRAADSATDASVKSAEAAADAEPVSLVVPGLQVLDVLRIGEETTFLGTRALQLLPTGDTLETAHLPPGVDPTVLPPLRSGWSELIQPRGSGWLVMRAPVPPTTLAELLQRLEGGR